MSESEKGASPKCRPILFSASMVRALLECRKTQTRRIIKPQPEVDQGWEEEPQWALDWKDFEDGFTPEELARLCPYGQPGDLLWMRETIERAKEWGGIGYPADGTWYPDNAWAWKRNTLPSIHMPRGLSRLTLELTEVRVQRLQGISGKDCVAEGVEVTTPYDDGHRFYDGVGNGPQAAYRKIWEAINGPGSWDANPWVWALTFRVHQQNINQMNAQDRLRNGKRTPPPISLEA